MRFPDWPPATEAECSRDGMLSAAPEWHALVAGFAAGRDGRTDVVLDLAFGRRSPRTHLEEDVAEEAAYAIGGALVGEVLDR